MILFLKLVWLSVISSDGVGVYMVRLWLDKGEIVVSEAMVSCAVVESLKVEDGESFVMLYDRGSIMMLLNIPVSVFVLKVEDAVVEMVAEEGSVVSVVAGMESLLASVPIISVSTKYNKALYLSLACW